LPNKDEQQLDVPLIAFYGLKVFSFFQLQMMVVSCLSVQLFFHIIIHHLSYNYKPEGMPLFCVQDSHFAKHLISCYVF